MYAGNRESAKAEDEETEIRTNQRYNLIPRPKNREQFGLAQLETIDCTNRNTCTFNDYTTQHKRQTQGIWQ